MNQGSTKADKPNGAELARELGISKSVVSVKRLAGKSDEQIRQEARDRNNKEAVSKNVYQNINESKAQKLAADAALAELELAQKSGQLISYEFVNQVVSTMIIRARDILLRIAPELRDRLAAETDPIKIHEMIEAEIVRALGELKEVPK